MREFDSEVMKINSFIISNNIKDKNDVYNYLKQLVRKGKLSSVVYHQLLDWDKLDNVIEADIEHAMLESAQEDTNKFMLDESIFTLNESNEDYFLQSLEDIESGMINNLDNDLIDDELRTFDRIKRILHSNSSDVIRLQDTWDIYSPSSFGQRFFDDVKDTKVGKLWTLDDIQIIEDKDPTFSTYLYFKDESTANDYIKRVDEVTRGDFDRFNDDGTFPADALHKHTTIEVESIDPAAVSDAMEAGKQAGEEARKAMEQKAAEEQAAKEAQEKAEAEAQAAEDELHAAQEMEQKAKDSFLGKDKEQDGRMRTVGQRAKDALLQGLKTAGKGVANLYKNPGKI